MSSASTIGEKANPRSLPQPLTSICAGLAVLGVVAFVYGLRSDPQAAWLAAIGVAIAPPGSATSRRPGVTTSSAATS